MKEQNYEKNFVSYCEVVRAGRRARVIESIGRDYDSIVERLMQVVSPDCLPASLKILHSQLWSLQLKADKDYKDLFDRHIAQLDEKQ